MSLLLYVLFVLFRLQDDAVFDIDLINSFLRYCLRIISMPSALTSPLRLDDETCLFADLSSFVALAVSLGSLLITEINLETWLSCPERGYHYYYAIK